MSSRLAGHNRSISTYKEAYLSTLSGLESGIATTTAIVIGLTITERSASFVLAASIVAVAVQAFNAASTRYTSLRASQRIDDSASDNKLAPLLNSILQFITHTAAAFIPISPLLFVANPALIILFSLCLGLLMLLIIGGMQGIFLNIEPKENLIEVFASGLLVILVGTIAGLILR